jgi:hypothetical protein
MRFLPLSWGLLACCTDYQSTKHHIPEDCNLQIREVWFVLTFWHRSFTFNSNRSPTWCKNFLVYYHDVCLQLNMFRAFFRPGAQWLQWQPLVLPLYRGDSRAVFVVGPAGNQCPLSLGNGWSPYGHINQRPQIQFRAPDDERCAARNMLSL